MTRTRAELLAQVDPEFHEDFLEFIQTGESRPEFLAYLNSKKQCQDAVEAAFDREAEVFRKAVDLIRGDLAGTGEKADASAPQGPDSTT